MKKFQYFLICSIFVLLSDFAFAIDESSDNAVSPHFIINATQDTKVDFILAKQKIDAVIIRSIADVTVEQHYVNRGKGAIEGVYVFPASTRAAVYRMNMQIGKRLIIAQIKKKDDARQEYETAKQEGKRAALLEQFEDNVFKMNVANIMQGDTVITIMKYTENLDASNGIYEFVYPTVVAPRYVSPTNKGKNDDEYGEIPYIDTKLIPDFNFEMNVVLNSGLNIDTIYSKSHKFDFNYSVINGIRYKADAKLNDSEFPANRDIILNFSFANQIYQTGLLVNEKDKYFMLTLQPPKRIEPISIINREYIFVMDVSGSMNGFPIDISKNIMKRIISGLDEDDLFNIVFFAGGSEMLFCMSQKADKMNKKFAEIFIENQKGGGGTELLPALQKVMNIPKVKGYSRIIPILTDGAISISSVTFNLIRNNIGDANIFSFGIGSSVNRDIIEGMARAGFGEKFIATNSEDGMKQGEQMLNMIDSPIMTDIKAEFNGWNVQDVTPSKIPDLFLNKPITIYGKYEGNLGGEIKISGQYGAERISVTMPLQKFAIYDSSNSIRYLAVRNKIAELNDLYNHDYNYKSSNKDSLEKIITDLCLQNNLLSKFTSFIAVDYEIVNKGGNSEKVNQINAVPKGMNKEFQNVDVMSRASSVGGDGVDLGGISAEYGSTYSLVSTIATEEGEVLYGGFSSNIELNDEEEPEPDEFVAVEKEPGVDLNRLQKVLVYPDLARRADIEGRVIVRVLVGPDGKVIKRYIESSDHQLLHQSALNAIDQYGLFTPAIQNGQVVSCWVSIPIEYRSSDRKSKFLNDKSLNKKIVGFAQEDIIDRNIPVSDIIDFDSIYNNKSIAFINLDEDVIIKVNQIKQKIEESKFFTYIQSLADTNKRMIDFIIFLTSEGKIGYIKLYNKNFKELDSYDDELLDIFKGNYYVPGNIDGIPISNWLAVRLIIKNDSLGILYTKSIDLKLIDFENVQIPKFDKSDFYKYTTIPKFLHKNPGNHVVGISIIVLKDNLKIDCLRYGLIRPFINKILRKDNNKYIKFNPLMINKNEMVNYTILDTIDIKNCISDSVDFDEEIFKILFGKYSKSYLNQNKPFQNQDTVKFRISIFDNDCNYYVNNKDMTYIIDTSDPDGYFPFLFAGKGPGSIYEVQVPAKDFLYKFPELELAKGKMVKVRVMIEE